MAGSWRSFAEVMFSQTYDGREARLLHRDVPVRPAVRLAGRRPARRPHQRERQHGEDRQPGRRHRERPDGAAHPAARPDPDAAAIPQRGQARAASSIGAEQSEQVFIGASAASRRTRLTPM